eukprot:2045640-Amphidinium_carterae.1
MSGIIQQTTSQNCDEARNSVWTPNHLGMVGRLYSHIRQHSLCGIMPLELDNFFRTVLGQPFLHREHNCTTVTAPKTQQK